MSRKLTNYDVDERIKGRPIKRIGDVNGTGKAMEWECPIDGFRWVTTPDIILRGSGCPKCSGNLPLSNDVIDHRIQFRQLKRVGNYTNANTKIEWECLRDGFRWFAIPSSILHGRGCPRCGNSLPLTNDIIDIRLKGRSIKRIGNIINAKTKIEWECLKDGFRWLTTPNSIIDMNSGCPKCKSSHGEDFIEKFLKDNGFIYIKEAKFTTCRYENELPFDFFIPNKRVLIEHDGEQHFEQHKLFHKNRSLEEQIEIDFIKSKWAKNNGYFLIRLSYDMTDEEKIASLSNIRFYKDC